MSTATRIVVVGSLNHDITVWVPHRPGPDETLHGSRVEEFRGGKGANQAVAAARLGAEVSMVGCVGIDARANFLLDGLDVDGVDRSYVHRVEEPTGVALITVDPDDVSIVVVAGANSFTDASLVEEARPAIEGADALLLQGEVGEEAAVAAARIARAAGVTVVLNPAPFNAVGPAVAPLSDVVMVNRHEAAELGEVGCEVLVTTLGPRGCTVSVGGTDPVEVPSPDVEVVDPTGAGDAFAAAFAVRWTETGDALEAARFAVCAGALAVTVAGAQSSLPDRVAVDRLRARASKRVTGTP